MIDPTLLLTGRERQACFGHFWDIAMHPVTEGMFVQEYFDQEKLNLRRDVEGRSTINGPTPGPSSGVNVSQ